MYHGSGGIGHYYPTVFELSTGSNERANAPSSLLTVAAVDALHSTRRSMSDHNRRRSLTIDLECRPRAGHCDTVPGNPARKTETERDGETESEREREKGTEMVYPAARNRGGVTLSRKDIARRRNDNEDQDKLSERPETTRRSGSTHAQVVFRVSRRVSGVGLCPTHLVAA